MILKAFSIYDSKACFFGNPFFAQKEEQAIRDFGDAVNSNEPNNGFARHPEDYSLFYIGDFDNENGEFSKIIPRNLITASACKSFKPQQLDLFNANGKEKEPASA